MTVELETAARPDARPAAGVAAVRGRSLWDDARRRLVRNMAAVTSMIVLAVIVLAALFGPYLLPFRFDEIDKQGVMLAPFTEGHLMGTDQIGRDLAARLLTGLRLSLVIGLVATSVALLIGVAWGATAGYLGGRVDETMMRIVDVLYSMPFIFLVIILTVTFGQNIILIFVAIGAVEWLTMSRIVRAQTMSLKNMEFVEAARAAGLSRPQIIFRHVVPNLLGPVVVYVTLTVPNVILLESFLSFIGLGAQEPHTSLGMLINIGVNYMEEGPWLLIIPCVVMAILLLALNLVGDGLRDAIDPKDR